MVSNRLANMKTKITPQADQVIFGRMKYLFNFRITEKWSKGTQVSQYQRIENIILFGRRKLDQTHLFTISMQTIGFGVDGNTGLRSQVPDHMIEDIWLIHPDGRR